MVSASDLTGPGRRTAAGATLAVSGAMVALEVAFGAPLADSLLFVLYQVGFRIVPGVLLFRLLASNPGNGLRQLALGWALGCGLETAAFMLTAALDVRAAFAVYPLLVAVPALALLVRRGRARPPAPPVTPVSGRAVWALAAVCLLAIVLFGAKGFTPTPLPGGEPIELNQDVTYHLGIAAEAKHHWPVGDPNVAGEPFPYHWFAHLHMAAASQITGIELSTVYLRLVLLPSVLLVILLFAAAGSSLLRSLPAGLLAACLALFIGDLQLQTAEPLPAAPFLGLLVLLLISSPSFLFGMATFLALATVIGERLTSRPGESGSVGDWSLVGLFTLAATNAKLSILPVTAAALAGYGAWLLLRRRRLPRRPLAAGAIVSGGFVLNHLSQYAGHSSGMRLHALDTINRMPAVAALERYANEVLPSVPLRASIVSAAAVLFGLVGLLGAQLGGAAWARRTVRLGSGQGWLAALLASGLGFLFLMSFPGGGSQLYFVFMGVAAGCLLAAHGLELAWRARPRVLERPWVVAAIAAVAIGGLILIMRAPVDSGADFFTGPDPVPRVFAWWYGGLFLLLAILAGAAALLLRPRRWWASALVMSTLLTAAVVGAAFNYLAPPLRERAEPPAARALTRDAYRALRWMQSNTAPGEAFAANHDGAYRNVYAAFAERRSYAVGWAYSRRTFDGGYDRFLAGTFRPFLERRKLLRPAFAGDQAALDRLAADGVTYLFLDPAANLPVNRAALAIHTRTVYRSGKYSVLRLEPAA